MNEEREKQTERQREGEKEREREREREREQVRQLDGRTNTRRLRSTGDNVPQSNQLEITFLREIN